MWDSSADPKHNTVLLLFADAIDPLGPAGLKQKIARVTAWLAMSQTKWLAYSMIQMISRSAFIALPDPDTHLDIFHNLSAKFGRTSN